MDKGERSSGIHADLKETVRKRLLEKLGNAEPALIPGEDLEPHIEEALLRERRLVPRSYISRLAEELEDELFGLGPLEVLLRDEGISEIMINGPDQAYVERDGLVEPVDLDLGSDARVLELVRRVIGPLNLRLDESSPMVDARLPDGSRLNAVIPPLSLNGATVTIRRFRLKPFSATELVGLGTFTPEMASFFEQAVANKTNTVISGGASSGKTTLLNVFSCFIHAGERLITIEDAAELRIDHPHVIRLESRPANIEGRGEVTVRDLVRNALRMRPDRIIIGEVRGSECLDMLQAMNTGHPGSLTTVHANSPRDLLNRLETMVMMSDVNLDIKSVRRQIGSALDLIVHTERSPGGERAVVEVASLSGTRDGEYDLEPLFGSPLPSGRERLRGNRARGLLSSGEQREATLA